MASKMMIKEQQDNQVILDESVEGASNDESDSDTETKNPNMTTPSGDDSSEYSSESASRFIVMPVAQTSKKKIHSLKKFSDEDEIALLEGLAVFWADGRKNKWSEFYQFIKDDLPNPFTKIQISEKIRKFKKKYEAHTKRARVNGGCFHFSSSHDSIVFELSKRLWGDEKSIATENVGAKKISRERKRKRVGTHGEENQESSERLMEIVNNKFELAYPLLYSSCDEYPYAKIVKDKLNLIGQEKAEELEKKWRELKDEEHCLEAKKIVLIKGYLLQ